MSFGLSLDVKVSRGSIDLKEARDHAAGMVVVIPGVFDFVTGGGEGTGEIFVFLGLDGSFVGNCIEDEIRSIQLVRESSCS
jgi:uncharacterized protein YcfJ